MAKANTQKPSIIGIPPSQRKDNQWYKRGNNNILELSELQKLPKAKAVSYMKVMYGSRGGSKLEIQYWKTLDNGYMIYVDVANMRIGIVLGLSANRGIIGSNKREYDKAFKQVSEFLKQ